MLAREALRAARAARSEPEFFTLLERAGLPARLRAAPDQAGCLPGWSVTLPGLTDRAGQPAWFAAGTLDPALRLGELRARWRAGAARRQARSRDSPGLKCVSSKSKIGQGFSGGWFAVRTAVDARGGGGG